jgi:ParB family transcriptional regulator, chromosome partitioning protein
MEISENENRKEFTFSERVDWARRLERIEKARAEERKKATQFGTKGTDQENFPEPDRGQTRDIVAEKSGFGSGKQYEKAKYIADHADPEIIARLDDGEISIHRAYQETKRKLEEAERRASESAAANIGFAPHANSASRRLPLYTRT